MGRAPKKFTDATRSEITQEWLDWFAKHSEESKDTLVDHVVYDLHELPENRWPEDYDKDLGEGAWIFVIEEPHTELKSRFTVPTPSIWWARPDSHRPGAIDVGTSGRPMVIPGLYRVVIETPGGSLWLYPHEYTVCTNPLPLITDPECTIHSLGGRPALDEEKQEQLFYLQSRGWSYQDAILQIMDGLDMRDWGWVELPEYARAMFEGVGRRRVFA